MRRRHDETPARKVLAHQVREAVLAGRIERGGWLIQQPKGARHCDQAGQGEAPPLPGRKVGGRQVGDPAKADPGQRG